MRRKPSQPAGSAFRLVAVTVFFTTALLLLATAPGMAAPPQVEEAGRWIPDGVWVGAFSGSDSISVSGTQAEASFNGTLSFEVVARQLLGDFTASGFSSSENEVAYALASFNSKGVLQGTADVPIMLPTWSSFDFAINLKDYGTTVEDQLTMTEGFSEMELTVLSFANCNQVSGNFDAGAMQNFDEQNVNVMQLQTEFTATRVSGIYEKDPFQYQFELGQLMIDANQLIADTLANQTLDGDAFFDVLTRAADLDSGIAVDHLCTTGTGGNKFASTIIGIIAKLVNLVYAHPDWFTPIQLNQIAYAAANTGAIGAGAADEALAINLTEKLEKVTSDKLDYYDKNPDCTMIFALDTVAQYLGTDSLMIKTEGVMASHGCQGL